MKNRIKNYIRAGYPGLFLTTHEETRAEAIIGDISRELEFSLHSWDCAQGHVDHSTQRSHDRTGPDEILRAIADLADKSVVLLRDFHLILADPNPMIYRLLKEALAVAKSKNIVLVFVAPALKLPAEFQKLITVIEFDLPSRDELGAVLDGLAANDVRAAVLDGMKDAVLDAAGGLTTTEAEDAFSLSIIEHGAIVPEVIAREKGNTVKKNGILEIVECSVTLDDIGGLDNLKSWLLNRRCALDRRARDYGLPVPKGVLIVGIAGTGKSLTAKACASAFGGIPLLRLDCGAIFAGLVGQSEANIRMVQQTAAAIAPCVLWLDEVEKGFSGTKGNGSNDSGTTARVFGSFLQWLNDKTAPVFVVATANDVTKLPPEFLRKGRFDEMFFVDLPTPEERDAIWQVVTRRRNRDFTAFSQQERAEIISATDGFSGVEIEAVFDGALFSAFREDTEPTAMHILDEAITTVPLSRSMSDDLESIRSWANGRTRPASSRPKLKALKSPGRKLAA